MPSPRRLAAVLVLAAALAPRGSAAADDAKPSAPAPAKAPAAKTPAPKDAPGQPAVAAAARAATPSTLEDALRILGRRRCDVDFREMAMDDVVAFIAKVGGLNAMVGPEYRRTAAGALPAVTLRLRDVTLRELAVLVAKTTSSEMVLRDGVLQFTTPQDARGTPVLRLFSIADLTFRIRNFPGPDIQLHTGDVKYVQEEESDQASPFDDPEKIVELVKKFTGEGTWADEGVSISADDRKLVIRQYPKVLKEIAAFLAVLRAAK